MKKTVISSLAMSIFASTSMTTTGCSNPATPLDRMRDRINIINNNDGKIYLYKEYSEVLSGKLNISTIESLDEINFTNNFTAIVFMVQHYEAMTKEFTQRLFGDFLNRSDNVMLIFLDFSDLNFLQYTTTFFSEWGNYDSSGTFFNAFDNFEGRKVRIDSEIGGELLANPIIIEEQFIAAFAAGIMFYIWQQ